MALSQKSGDSLDPPRLDILVAIQTVEDEVYHDLSGRDAAVCFATG